MADDRVDMGWRAIGAFLKKWRQKRRKKKDGIGSAAKEPEMWVENPYLPQFRNIMEQVLKKRGISYRDFAPVCIDEEKPELLLMEEDIVTVLHELERDLNALTYPNGTSGFFLVICGADGRRIRAYGFGQGEAACGSGIPISVSRKCDPGF